MITTVWLLFTLSHMISYKFTLVLRVIKDHHNDPYIPSDSRIIHKHMTWAFYWPAACVNGNFASFKIQKHMTTIDKSKHASIHMSILLYRAQLLFTVHLWEWF